MRALLISGKQFAVSNFMAHTNIQNYDKGIAHYTFNTIVKLRHFHTVVHKHLII